MMAWFKSKMGSPETQARTAGVFAASCVVGLVVNLLTMALSAINFAPLQAIVAADDQFYFMLATPRIRNPESLHRVVLVDIDDDAVGEDNIKLGGATPRTTIAELVKTIRDADPKAIFLDIDLRTPTTDDQILHDELARAGRPPVLIPYFLEDDGAAECADQARLPAAQKPILLGVPFDDVIGRGAVVRVHGRIETGAFGMVSGTCSSLAIRGPPGDIPAAMVEALRLAGDGASGAGAAQPAPSLIHPLWRIRDKQAPPSGADGAPLRGSGGLPTYTWIPAGYVNSTRPDVFRSAIVVIGSSQRGSDDTHATPVGPMMGALIHANLALDAQQPHEELFSARTTRAQAAFDILLTILTSAVVALVCWHPVHLRAETHGEPGLLHKPLRLLMELAVVATIFLVLAVPLLVAAGLGLAVLPVWRFAFIGSLLGGVAIVVMEAAFFLGEAAQRAVEAAYLRYGGRGE